MMTTQQLCPQPLKQVIHFLKTHGNTTSREEKDTLVSELRINENETALLTFMFDQRHITLLSLLRKIYEHCTKNEAPYDTDTIVSDKILYDIFKTATFNTYDIKSMLLPKVQIIQSQAPEYILDLKLYKMTGLPILTTTIHIPPTSQLGPTHQLPAFYTDDSDNSTSTGPPPLEDFQGQTEINSDAVTSDSSNTSYTLETSPTSCSQSSTSDPEPPKPTATHYHTTPSGTDDEHTHTQTYEQPTTGSTRCIICSQTSIQRLPYCHQCWQEIKTIRPPHKRKLKIPLHNDNPPATTLPTCITCNTNPSNSAFVHGNTGHVTTCYPCSRLILKKCNNRCPICNHKTSCIIKLFM